MLPLGPWYASGKHVRYRLPGFTTSELLADCDTEEHAQIIAAVPEMLNALRGIESTYVFLDSLTAGHEPQHTNTIKALRKVREAIVKAAGEEPSMRCPECGSSNCIAEPFDFGVCSQTGYHEAGVWGKCLACGIQSDVVDFEP